VLSSTIFPLGGGFLAPSIHPATRGHPLSKARAAANRAKSRIRARIEHVFGAQETAPGGRLVRTIGIVRARAKIGLQNFVYNIRRRDARTNGRRLSQSLTSAPETSHRADGVNSVPTGKAGICPSAAHEPLEI
jgi:hypothetical protein